MRDPGIVSTVKQASYVRHQHGGDGTEFDALRVDTDRGSVYIPNGNFTVDNDALKVMAFCGVRPSTLHEIDGCSLPVKIDSDGSLSIPDWVCESGRRVLENAEWFLVVSDDETEIEVE